MENMPRLPKRAVPERAVPRLSIPCHANNRKIAASSPHGHEKNRRRRKEGPCEQGQDDQAENKKAEIECLGRTPAPWRGRPLRKRAAPITLLPRSRAVWIDCRA